MDGSFIVSLMEQHTKLRTRQLSSTKAKISSQQNQEFAEFIKNKRGEMKAKDFLKSLNVSPEILDVYRTWERGRTIPKVEQTWDFLKVLGPEGRDKFNIHLGPMLDMLRGDPSQERGSTFDALALILEDGKASERAHFVKEIQAAAQLIRERQAKEDR